MATIRKTPSASWKAVIRKRGWPPVIKTFRAKRDAQDWARRTEDDMVRGVYIDRASSERMQLKSALKRYAAEVIPTKRPSTARREKPASDNLNAVLGHYSLAALSPDVLTGYRDRHLSEGLSASTVRLELSLFSHLFTVAIKEWRIGLDYNPVANIRKPAPHRGRDRRLGAEEEKKLLAACDKHSNPMLGQIVRVALHTGMRAGEIHSLRRSTWHGVSDREKRRDLRVADRARAWRVARARRSRTARPATLHRCRPGGPQRYASDRAASVNSPLVRESFT